MEYNTKCHLNSQVVLSWIEAHHHTIKPVIIKLMHLPCTSGSQAHTHNNDTSNNINNNDSYNYKARCPEQTSPCQPQPAVPRRQRYQATKWGSWHLWQHDDNQPDNSRNGAARTTFFLHIFMFCPSGDTCIGWDIVSACSRPAFTQHTI